jgi:dolichol kinase
MRPDLLNTLILGAAFLVVFGLAEVLHRYLHVKAEYTRKFVHIVSGLITLLFPLFINNQWFVLLLCSSFALLLWSSLRFKMLPSIHAVGRQTLGSFVYPAAVYGCYLVYNHYNKYLYFYEPILVLAICDPLAALIGKKWGVRKYNTGSEQKSWIGSAAFFAAAVVINLMLFISLSQMPLVQIILFSLASALLAAAAEGLSRNGMDNITVPGISLLMLVLISGSL